MIKNMKGVKKWENIKNFNFSRGIWLWVEKQRNGKLFFYLVEKRNEMIENVNYINLLMPLLDKKNIKKKKVTHYFFY